MNDTSKNNSILITGATGTIGSELARQLSVAGFNFKAMVRSFNSIGSLKSLSGSELVKGDFNDPQSLSEALSGVEKVFLLTNSTEQAEIQQIALVDAAISAGVKHIVKLSQFAADIQSPVRYLRYHAAVEQKIIASGIDYTFLRPNLFMQGLLVFRDPIIHQGKFFAPAGQAKVSLVDIRDIAAVAAKSLTEDGHQGKIYNLTGPEALTHTALASILSAATSREIRYIDVTPEDMRNAVLSVGFPEWQAEGLLEDYAHYARGEAALISPDIEAVTGKPPYKFEAFAKDYAYLFSA
ncbi:SDR family oxidoreductase [Pedobacter sp. R-06]|uniref:SDR family oxidoreductase n=1 Tax=Pedobacter sp. R-06 TaxID=3404051 RepID=UPI003CE68B5B